MFQGDFFAHLKTYNITDVSEMLTVPGEMVTIDKNGGKSTLEAIGKKLVFKRRTFSYLAMASFHIKVFVVLFCRLDHPLQRRIQDLSIGGPRFFLVFFC